MGDKTGIEWTDATWNPVTGCSKVSAGCAHCYAETFAERWRGTPGHHFEQGFDLKLWPERLDIPRKWTKPRRIFVNSMSDLFHEGVPTSFIRNVFQVMVDCPQHTFQVLTKRPERMKALLSGMAVEDVDGGNLVFFGNSFGATLENFKNIWLGVSVEDQRAADKRIPLLLQTPAAVRFLSCEPLLAPLDLVPYLWKPVVHGQGPSDLEPSGMLNWIICGGESGPGARPMQKDWARSIQKQTALAGVPFFFKQWGGVRKKEAGCLLDGKEYKEFPKA